MKPDEIGLTAITVASMFLAGAGMYYGNTDAAAFETPNEIASVAPLTLSLSERDLILSLLEPSTDPNYQLQEISRHYSAAWIVPTLEVFHFVRQAPSLPQSFLVWLARDLSEHSFN